MEPVLLRKTALTTWLDTLPGLSPYTLTPMTGDASFRRYYRLTSGRDHFVVMDAPPPTENTRPFVAIAYALQALGLKTPDIFGADLNQGFLLLSDFGDETYLRGLNAANAREWYGSALDALAVLQGCERVQGHVIPVFSAEFMQQEWVWHQDWVLHQWLGLHPTAEEQAGLDAAYHALVQSAVSQPQGFMHRDYHAGNLMHLAPGEVGLLDFQDAFKGPLTYDLASLLRDCYIDWPDAMVKSLAVSYLDRLQGLGLFTAVSEAQFLRWFDWMGVQRHLKAMMTFARKHLRDHQSGYLPFIPRTLNYILTVTAAYPELAALHTYYQTMVLPRVDAKGVLCA